MSFAILVDRERSFVDPHSLECAPETVQEYKRMLSFDQSNPYHLGMFSNAPLGIQFEDARINLGRKRGLGGSSLSIGALIEDAIGNGTLKDAFVGSTSPSTIRLDRSVISLFSSKGVRVLTRVFM